MIVIERRDSLIKEYDSLTGLYNFSTFLMETRHMLDANPDIEYAMLVLDIERFKVINEMFDMEKGDMVLRAVAAIITEIVDKVGGCYGRIGSDRFVCCFPKENYDEEEITTNLSFVISERDLNYRVYIKGGLYYIEDSQIDVIKMCDRALIALKEIKGHYSEMIAVYAKGAKNDLIESQQLLSDMESALANKEFKLYIQPVYRLKDNEMVSGEVLVRWQHPKHGLLFPGKFIPLFEKNYVVSKLDKYIWEEACILIKEMMDTGSVMPLSVNVSRVDLIVEDVADIFINLVNKYNIPPKYLKVEITESAYIDNPAKMVETIKALKDNGFTVLMDDFGAGYSSLNTLKDLSFDVLKIDKKLIDEVDVSDKGGSVVMSIIRMARWLGMQVVAEGIEKCTQANLLRMIGCDYLQGFLYSRPVDVPTFMKMKGDKVTIANMQMVDTLSMESIYSAKDMYTRVFLEELIGPLIMIELEGDTFRFIEANEAYSRKYENPAVAFLGELGVFDKDKDNKIRNKLIKKCNEAYETKSSEHYTFAQNVSEYERRWYTFKIYYMGDNGDSKVFAVGVSDVTKDMVKANKREVKELLPLLSGLFVEIVEFDYTKNVISFVLRNRVFMDMDKAKEPLDKAYDTLINKMIAPTSQDEAKYYLSKEFVDEYFSDDNKKIFSFKLDMYDKDRVPRPCEMTLINRIAEGGSASVMVCTRVLE